MQSFLLVHHAKLPAESALTHYSKEESPVRWGDAGEKEVELWSRDKSKKPHYYYE